jgi:hypothetical protein
LKVCNKCLEEKPIEDFKKTTTTRSGRTQPCKKCAAVDQKSSYSSLPLEERRKKFQEQDRKMRERITPEDLSASKRRIHLKKTYGITPEQWDALFEGQGGACALCRSKSPGTAKTWHTDHCHRTGRVRGILCFSCNITLGFMESRSWMIAEFSEPVKRYLKG